MKKLVSLLLVLALCLTAVAAFAEDNTGVYTVFNETGEKVTELYLIDNVTEDMGENLVVDDEFDGLGAGEVIELTYSIPAEEDGSHRLTLSFKTESGYEAAFETLSIEVAPITLLAADAMTGATAISFTEAETEGTYTITNLTGEKVTELYLADNVTEEKGDNLVGEEGLAADATITLSHNLTKLEDPSHRLTLTFITESGYEGTFETLSIEVAPIFLLSADGMTGATMISFRDPRN